MTKTRIVCMSDTHTYHRKVRVPDGDLLLHAGDFSFKGSYEETKDYLEWLDSLDMPSIIICGNHDFIGEKNPELMERLCRSHGVTYLNQKCTEFDGLKIWGEPRQPWFFAWAFNVQREDMKETCWDAVPPNADVLLTHGPPHGYCDTAKDGRVGCVDQTEWIKQYQPKLVVCGHIHEARGYAWLDNTLIVNASICTRQYKPTNPAIRVTFEDGNITLVEPDPLSAPGKGWPQNGF